MVNALSLTFGAYNYILLPGGEDRRDGKTNLTSASHTKKRTSITSVWLMDEGKMKTSVERRLLVKLKTSRFGAKMGKCDHHLCHIKVCSFQKIIYCCGIPTYSLYQQPNRTVTSFKPKKTREAETICNGIFNQTMLAKQTY